jgi:hypothetical protein
MYAYWRHLGYAASRDVRHNYCRVILIVVNMMGFGAVGVVIGRSTALHTVSTSPFPLNKKLISFLCLITPSYRECFDADGKTVVHTI